MGLRKALLISLASSASLGEFGSELRSILLNMDTVLSRLLTGSEMPDNLLISFHQVAGAQRPSCLTFAP